MPRPSQSHLTHRLRTLTLTSPTLSALFYARIWLALSPATQTDHEALHALALAFLAAKEPYSALHLVRELADDDARRSGCAGCGVIVARCCEAVGRVGEGAAVLERAVKRGGGYNLPSLAGDEAVSSHLMLAQLSRKSKNISTSIEYYQKALTEEPWLWEAFTGLCDIGNPPQPETLFPDPPIASTSKPPSVRASRPPTLSPNPMPRSSTSEMPFLPKRATAPLSPLGPGASASQGFFTPDVGGQMMGNRMNMGMGSSWDTPSVIGDTTFPSITTSHVPLPLPVPPRKPLPGLKSAISSATAMIPASLRPPYTTSTQTPISSDLPSAPKPPGMKRPRGQTSRLPHSHSTETPYSTGLRSTTTTSEAELRRNQRDLKSIEPNGVDTDAPVRRSSRLKTTTIPSKHHPKVSGREISSRATRSRSTTSSTSGITDHQYVTSPTTSQDIQLQSQADDWLRDILRRCARAYRFLSLYKCQEAIREIDTLPSDIQNLAFALTIYARSSYELANYIPALRAFTSLHNIEPYNLESSHYHSTLLWHLGDSASLSTLAQELVAVDKGRAEPWIAAGNCFSLEKDHDEAMRCFRRATQVNPGCAYAWTLCGYEAVEMEEYERAIGFYRNAIKSDQRHYNAWYGMGSVYLKMGKIRHAEHHYRRAAEINPTNAILLSCIGMVLEQQNDNRQALTYYEQACKYAPDSPMVAFKRIRVLVALNEIDTAITLLEPLCRTAPDEAQVQFLLGKCYLRKNRRAEAMFALTNARELQPKLEAAVKATVAANGEEVDDDEDDEEED